MLLSFFGKGSNLARQHMAQYTFVDVYTFNIHVTDLYEHLGGMLTTTHNVTPEVKHRSLAVLPIARGFKRTVAAKTQLNVTQLSNLADSLMVSSLLYNSHTWIDLSPTNIKFIRTCCTQSAAGIETRRICIRSVRGSPEFVN